MQWLARYTIQLYHTSGANDERKDPENMLRVLLLLMRCGVRTRERCFGDDGVGGFRRVFSVYAHAIMNLHSPTTHTFVCLWLGYVVVGLFMGFFFVCVGGKRQKWTFDVETTPLWGFVNFEMMLQGIKDNSKMCCNGLRF